LVAEEIQKAIETTDPNFSRKLEHRIIYADGKLGYITVRFFIVKDDQGSTIKTYGVNQDMTEWKKREEEIASLQEQLYQAQKMEAIGKLAGGVAHDFNNLLTIIKGYLQLSLLELDEGTELKNNIDEAIKAADKAAGLTRQLLAFSRRQVMEMKVLDLNDLLNNVNKMITRILGEDIEVQIHLSPDLGRVKLDQGQMEQVILNLAVNAKDAMPDGGKFIVKTYNAELDEDYARCHPSVKPGLYVMLSVTDTGIGMTPEVRNRIFEPFFTTKEKGKGTGLGLSTVYGIVKQSGGNIWVYSELGKGTTFKIYLPRVDEPLEVWTQNGENAEVPRGRETILIVEDEKTVREVAIRILKKQGYRVLDGSDGDEALRFIEEFKEKIDLILIDVVLPKMIGPRWIEKFNRIRHDFKVVYMSGYTDDAIAHHGILDKGMNYIEKPFTLSSLAQKVRGVLDQ
jgi:signal transduction histidine kinase